VLVAGSLVTDPEFVCGAEVDPLYTGDELELPYEPPVDDRDGAVADVAPWLGC
jgi:hypothetical protein